MVFSSSIFLVYFLPIFLIIYYLSPKKAKNFVLLFSSIFFYSWGAPKFIFVIIGTTIVDFHLVKWMDRSENETKRKLLLILSVCMNLGLLFYFKYSNFFIENFNVLLKLFDVNEISWTKLMLPIGISFYTFETMTYVVDVYRKVHKPLHNFWDYQVYIILFPKLIAGPIIRYHEISDQITDRSTNETIENKLTGFYRFVIGLAKKVLIANTLGLQADQVFALSPTDISTTTAWIGILAYTFQIYFDFSGYSDMAIGIGKMIGFKFPENFNNPYIAQGITDFWRRWHMTLGAWMRNYLYIPLGGNKVKTKRRLYFNLWFVFLASGLWHGASWSFIIWGAYHGLFLVLERAGLLKFYKRIGKTFSVIITFLIVVTGWVFFRVENIDKALLFIQKMYVWNSSGLSVTLQSEFSFTFLIAVLFSFFAFPKIGEKIQNMIYYNDYSLSRYFSMALISLLLFFISLSAITASGFNPFIYFRF
jgi:alginate O-acetyltransferase complex protein AlgI